MIDKRLEWKVKTINEDIIRCNKCKKMRTSKIDDVSTKNPNYYYKFCGCGMLKTFKTNDDKQFSVDRIDSRIGTHKRQYSTPMLGV